MPRVSQTTQQITSSGLAVALTAPAVSPDGDIADVGERTFLMVRNASGVSINVTVDATTLVEGLAVPDRVVAVAAGATTLIPLLPTVYRQQSGADIGRAYIDYSAVASVTRAVVAI